MALFRVPSLASASKCGVLASDAEKISLFSIDAALLISDLRALSSPSPTQTSRSLISGSSSLSSVSSSLFSDADHELSHLRRSPRAISSLTLITGSLISEAYHELSHI
ncbi:hypothetical protein F2Q69_00004550 [Brassica cretica]|uniref:Uncharacterized protein n=1 Tax=Brassica cretica TaxID=69181 RepID=A0A8S9NS18_BRACR|nr:hypothetical protein F2Q69_00004550 [Brassica cretica]